MKKLISFIFIIYLGIGLLNAEPTGKTSMNPFKDTSLLGVNAKDIYTAVVSTQQAKNVLEARDTRKELTVVNLDASNSVYMATYPATSSDLSNYQNVSTTTPITGLREISDSINEDVQPYTGDIYIIGVDTNTQIEIIEKY